MSKIDVKNGKLINAVTGEIIGDKMVVHLVDVEKVSFFKDTEYILISLKTRDTGESYFILPGEYTWFSLQYAAYVLGSVGKTLKDTPLVLEVNSKGELLFNFNLKLRSYKQKLIA